MNLAGDAPPPEPCGDVFMNTTTRSASGQWHRPQHHRVDNGEDGGVRRDAERERSDRGEGEGGTLRERAQGMFQILEKPFHVPSLDTVNRHLDVHGYLQKTLGGVVPSQIFVPEITAATII